MVGGTYFSSVISKNERLGTPVVRAEATSANFRSGMIHALKKPFPVLVRELAATRDAANIYLRIIPHGYLQRARFCPATILDNNSTPP